MRMSKLIKIVMVFLFSYKSTAEKVLEVKIKMYWCLKPILILLQDFNNDGFHYMVKTDLPDKTFSHSEHITNQLNNHEFVRVN